MVKKEEQKNVNTANYVVTRVFANKPIKEIILENEKEARLMREYLGCYGGEHALLEAVVHSASKLAAI